jgi:hypothetical protein
VADRECSRLFRKQNKGSSGLRDQYEDTALRNERTSQS